MIKIATLGPKGTYSDTATAKYCAGLAEDTDVEYFESIKLALNAIGPHCDIGILPVENFSEGFISLVLDHLLDASLSIISEIRLPIHFALVANCSALSDIRRIYVQFVAKGQCSEFLESMSSVNYISTESNIDSLQQVLKGQRDSAAIVPAGSFDADDFRLTLPNVNDYQNNETRFLVLRHGSHAVERQSGVAYKSSVIVMDENDHPGFLGEVLQSFSQRKINLTSIMSRPTRQTFGKYHFFIDFDGHTEDQNIAAALNEVAASCKVKVLGSYPRSLQR